VRRSRFTPIVVLVLVVSSALAGVELVLKDGRVLDGVDVQREGDLYLLTLDSGGVVPLPAELVDRVRLSFAGGTKKKTRVDGAPPGVVRGEAETIGGQILDEEHRGPTGMRTGTAQTLAGQSVRPPTPSEQTAALGPAAQFQKDIVRNDWVPTTDWNMDPHEQNNFAPSTWSKSIVDSDWQPTSAFDPKDDVMAESRSSWQQGLSDPTWRPVDGFK